MNRKNSSLSIKNIKNRAKEIQICKLKIYNKYWNDGFSK